MLEPAGVETLAAAAAVERELTRLRACEDRDVSEALAIRPTEERDLAFVLAAQDDPEAAAMITPRPRERHLAAIADPGEAHLVIERAGELVGYALISGLAGRHRNAEIRTLVVTRPGEGIGRGALALILERLFGERGMHRVWLDAIAGNDRAQRAYAAAGFVREGEMREAWRREDGRFESLVLMSILEHEWEARRDSGG